MSSKPLSSRSCFHIEFCHWNPPSCNLRGNEFDQSFKLSGSPEAQTWQQDRQHCWCQPQGKGHILPALHGQHRVPSDQFSRESFRLIPPKKGGEGRGGVTTCSSRFSPNQTTWGLSKPPQEGFLHLGRSCKMIKLMQVFFRSLPPSQVFWQLEYQDLGHLYLPMLCRSGCLYSQSPKKCFQRYVKTIFYYIYFKASSNIPRHNQDSEHGKGSHEVLKDLLSLPWCAAHQCSAQRQSSVIQFMTSATSQRLYLLTPAIPVYI